MENRTPADDGGPSPPGQHPTPGLPASFFSLRELLLLPNVMSFLRLPLAALFPLAARSKGATLTVLALAGLTDVLDGFLARERGEVTATGAVLDPIADKVFALSVVTTLVAQGKLPRWGIPALLAREILEAPLLFWVLVRSPESRAQDAGEDARAEGAGVRSSNVPGKVATVAQFAAVMAALELPAALPPALVLAAVTGTAAGILYWRRELGRR
jgi:cardiolipin synthase (CMP-forming)